MMTTNPFAGATSPTMSTMGSGAAISTAGSTATVSSMGSSGASADGNRSATVGSVGGSADMEMASALHTRAGVEPCLPVMTDQQAFTDAWLNRYNGCANTRPYVPIPLEYYEEMQYLSNEEFGELIRIMMWYCISGEVLPVRGALCHYITRVIDRQKRYYIEWASLSSKRSAAGKVGAAKRWNKNLGAEEETL